MEIFSVPVKMMWVANNTEEFLVQFIFMDSCEVLCATLPPVRCLANDRNSSEMISLSQKMIGWFMIDLFHKAQKF